MLPAGPKELVISLIKFKIFVKASMPNLITS
nr:MAG TPA: hypothetical protein [Caudoviricetes sp.]DAR22363.1 MAG TPA: hypothetical protein [Caudoviricetes sp.]